MLAALSGWQRTAPDYEMAQPWGTSSPSQSLMRLSRFTPSCSGTLVLVRPSRSATSGLNWLTEASGVALNGIYVYRNVY